MPSAETTWLVGPSFFGWPVAGSGIVFIVQDRTFRTAFPGTMAVLWVAVFAGTACAGTPEPGTISGVVADTSGSVVVGAIVTLETAASTSQRTAVTGQAGSFHFQAVEPGRCTITINAGGFAEWKREDVTVASGENLELPAAVLQVAPTATRVNVGVSQQELATEQIKTETQQRLFHVFPNYFVTYDPDAAPLNARQKLQLGWKTMIDPVTVGSSLITAGIEQARNSYHQFGQGMEGYGKRFGADYADGVNGVIIGGVLMQMVFRQDPRYFYKGTGSVRARLLYAVGTAFVCKGDNKRWQPDYSDVLGDVAAGEIATLYYPASSRTGLRIFHGVLLGFAGRAVGNLAQEFLFRRFTTHVSKTAPSQLVLREGTPVSLISVGDLSSAQNGPVAFVLARDIQVDGTTVAEAGATASGQATYSGGTGKGEAMHVALTRVELKIGSTAVRLRTAQQRGNGSPLQYHRVENSGRIAVVLYVAESVPLPPGR